MRIKFDWYNYVYLIKNTNKMTLPMTTKDVYFGRNVVEYDANWRPTRQFDWFDKLCNKIKSYFGDKSKIDDRQDVSNIDRV